MKIAPRQIDSFLQSPDPETRAVLVYGRDAGQVHERLASLIAAVLEDPDDPFCLSELQAADIRKDPARLVEEASALALTGGRRVVRILSASDALTPSLRDFLAEPKGEALLLLGADELGPRSTLRRLFEDDKQAAAVPCYGDEGAGLERIIREALHPLEIDLDARSYLLNHLGGDRLVTRRELEKLKLYVEGNERVTLTDVVESIGDSSTLTLEDIAFAVGQGARSSLEEALERVHLEGSSPVAILRATSHHFLRLHLVRSHMDRGENPGEALKTLKPQVFFKRVPAFREQAGRWSLPALGRALALLAEREVACKSSGLPAKAICDRTLLELATRSGKEG
ncbi:MAG: DNA polymerase III subunit delta [Alphaproteobacteria bacterium]|nr:DNA polymerase III subunit delta [Alphaproteobacteria bacterium]